MTRIRLILTGLIVTIVLIFFLGARTYTDWLWFTKVGYGQVFLTRWIYRLSVGAIATVFAFVVLTLNVWLARRLSPDTHFISQNSELEQFFRRARGYIDQYFALLAYAGSAVVAVLAGISMAAMWEEWLAFFSAVKGGVTDPLFGLDISFFFFTLPVVEQVQQYLMFVFILALGLAGFVHLARGTFNLGRGFRAVHGPGRAHMALLGGVLMSVFSLHWWIAAHQLVYSPRGAVFGAGFTDVNIILPAYNVLIYATLIGALVLTVALLMNRLTLAASAPIAILIIWAVGIVALPAVVQQYSVAPNEIARERQYISKNIKSTRAAFGLDKVDKRRFPVDEELTKATIEENRETIDGLRLWDWRPLKKTYGQIQEIRLYYKFGDVDLDRYVVDGKYRQLAISARELDIDQLPETAQTWINQHLVYTHGYGVVASPVNEIVDGGLPELIIKNIPPKSSTDLEVDRPEIYFGESTNDYVIVNTDEKEFDFPAGDRNKYATYSAKSGVSLKNYLTKLSFAYRFGTVKLVLSDSLNDKSRVLFHRNIKDRLETIAPFLAYDSDPYLVIVNGRLIWMVDAYTASSRYPYSKPASGGVNYIRNSVKATVDAYSGAVNFYVADPKDPIIRTYERAYPGAFKSFDEMDKELLAHVRYPETLLKIQAEVFSAYHMNDPQVFYNKEDLWDIPQELYSEEKIPMDPYYMILQLPGEDKLEFVNILPFTPTNKSNMIAWMAARSDPPNYGKLLLYSFPKDKLVYGPLQIEARLDQDPDISRQLSLWNQRGSKVIRGNLLVVPVGNSLMFVEPIYLEAEASELPELKRVAVGFGNKVVMEPTLEEGLAALFDDEEPPVSADEPADKEAGEKKTGADDEKDARKDERPIGRAARAFEEAEEAQRRGDWAEYGRKMKILKEALQDLGE